MDAAGLELPTLALERLARVTVELDEVHELGDSHWGRRRIIPIVGGRVEGESLAGEILPGGADWQVVHADGMATIDTRYAMRTDDGALIAIATQGVRHGPPEVLARVAAGEAVDPADYHFRVAVRLETGAPAYAWVNRRVMVATAARLAATVVYDLYALR